MSDSDSVSLHSEGDIEITGAIRIVRPRQDCQHEVRTALAGFGKADAGPRYADTDAYLGVYKGDFVEAYVKKFGKGGPRVHCGAQLAAIKERLDLDSRLQNLSESGLLALIQRRTMEDAPLSTGPAVTGAYQILESIESSPGAESGGDARVRNWGGKGEDVTVEAREQEERSRSPKRGDKAARPQVFHLRLVDIAAFIGFGVFVAYISIAFAFLLIWFISYI